MVRNRRGAWNPTATSSVASPVTVRARLKAAARAEGKTLEIQRKDDAVVFWLRGAG